jgi:hypothetical protein
MLNEEEKQRMIPIIAKENIITTITSLGNVMGVLGNTILACLGMSLF